MWKAVLQDTLRKQAIDITLDVAKRLQDADHVEKIASIAKVQSKRPITVPWRPFSVVYGDAALALFFGQFDRCFPEQGWDKVAHKYIVLAATSLEAMYKPAFGQGMFGGLAGLCFTTNYLARGGNRYRKLQNTLDELLYNQTIETLSSSSVYHGKVEFNDYDLISGPTGIGAYLVLRLKETGAQSALNAVINRLIFLSEWRDGKLGFFMPPETQATQQHLEYYPDGSIDCGLAHGVPGPLALLSLALLNDIERSDVTAAVQRLAKWLLDRKYEDTWGINWPYAVSPDYKGVPPHLTTRAAWCYGSPGISRALWLAGWALSDPQLKEIALEAFEAVWRRPINVRLIPAPILCHGLAGLLQVALRFANDTNQASIIEMSIEYAKQLINLYEPETLVGFRDIEPDGNKVDDSGLLNGAIGAALSLLAAATDVEPAWDRMFLLS